MNAFAILDPARTENARLRYGAGALTQERRAYATRLSWTPAKTEWLREHGHSVTIYQAVEALAKRFAMGRSINAVSRKYATMGIQPKPVRKYRGRRMVHKGVVAA